LPSAVQSEGRLAAARRAELQAEQSLGVLLKFHDALLDELQVRAWRVVCR
jgi:hypothetical protein